MISLNAARKSSRILHSAMIIFTPKGERHFRQRESGECLQQGEEEIEMEKRHVRASGETAMFAA